MKTLFALPILGLFILTTCADIPPPDTMHIDVTYNNERIDSVFYAQILMCMGERAIIVLAKHTEIAVEQLAIKEFDSDRDCYWYPAAECWVECASSKCDSVCTNLSEFKLAVYIPQLDKVFMSGVMGVEKKESSYAANLLPDGTIDMKKTVRAPGKVGISEHKVGMFTKALVITLLIELLIAFAYINVGKTAIPKYSKKQVRILSTVFLANLISLPVLWFIFFSIWNSFFMVILGEAFVILFEGVLIHFLNKTVLPTKDALLFSFILNVGSLFLGYPLYSLLPYVF
jgi:hypothetical protein